MQQRFEGERERDGAGSQLQLQCACSACVCAGWVELGRVGGCDWMRLGACMCTRHHWERDVAGVSGGPADYVCTQPVQSQHPASSWCWLWPCVAVECGCLSATLSRSPQKIMQRNAHMQMHAVKRKWVHRCICMHAALTQHLVLCHDVFRAHAHTRGVWARASAYACV